MSRPSSNEDALLKEVETRWVSKPAETANASPAAEKIPASRANWLFPGFHTLRNYSAQEKLGFFGFWIGCISVALSVLFYFFPIDTTPKGPPLTAAEVHQVTAEAMNHMATVRSTGSFAAIHAPKLKPLAEKLWSDKRYSEQAPDATALIFRVYAATLALSSQHSSNFLAEVEQAMPWLDRSVALYASTATKPKDIEELRAAHKFFSSLVATKPSEVEVSKLMAAKLRVAMTEAPSSDIERLVSEYIAFMSTLVTPRTGGNSPRDDLEYLKSHVLPGGFTLGRSLEVFQSTLRAQFPGKEVGGNPVFLPLPNGNTGVVYMFVGKDDRLLELRWEVNKSKGLIKPLNESARSAMNLGAK